MVMLALLSLAVIRTQPAMRRHRTVAFAARYACVALPALFALYVGVTRTQDYFHDYADVLAGLMIGTLAGIAGHTLEGLDDKLKHGRPTSRQLDGRAGAVMIHPTARPACRIPVAEQLSLTLPPILALLRALPCARACSSRPRVQQHSAEQWGRYLDAA